jgi:hypothetical protein
MIATFGIRLKGVNHSCGEAAKTLHYLSIAHFEGYKTLKTDEEFLVRYQRCIRMLNGMELTLEKQLPESDSRWPQSLVLEVNKDYGTSPPGFPEP